MIGDSIRAELSRSLEGDRRWVMEQRGEFLVRWNPEHLGEVMATRARQRVDADIAAFRASRNRESNRRALRDLG